MQKKANLQHQAETTRSGQTQASGAAGNKGSMRRWMPLAGLAAAMAVAWWLGLHEYLTLSSLIRHRIELLTFVDSHLWGAIAVYALVYVAAVALSFPGASLLTIAGGFLFGWFVGGTATVAGATVGATLIYMIARSSLGEALTRRAGPFVSRLSEGFRENAFSYLLFLRLTPIFPFWLVNIAPAMFHVPLWTYAAATFFGIVPGTYAFAVIGSGLDSLIEAQEAASPGCAAAGTCHVDVAALLTPELIAAFFALGFAALIPVGLKKFRGRREA